MCVDVGKHTCVCAGQSTLRVPICHSPFYSLERGPLLLKLERDWQPASPSEPLGPHSTDWGYTGCTWLHLALYICARI